MPKGKHIKWSPDDVKHIAGLMFADWLENPFRAPIQIYREIMPKLAENLRRQPHAFTAQYLITLPSVYCTLVREHMAKFGAGTESAPPQIIEVEKIVMPEPFAALAKIPTKLIVAELYERTANLALLTQSTSYANPMAGPVTHAPARHANGNGYHEPPAIQLPPPERKPRIAVVGLFSKQFDVLAEKVTAAKKDDLCELKFYDKDKHVEPVRADFCIIQRHTGHHWWDKARATLGDKKNVYFVDGGIEMTFQKVLDIISRQPAIR